VYQECKLNVTVGKRYSRVKCRLVPCALSNFVLWVTFTFLYFKYMLDTFLLNDAVI